MGTGDGGRRNGRRARHEATRRRILEAAWALSREHGLQRWSLRDVAGVVGMRAPSLCVYFESKHDLYDAMYADGYGDLLARIDATSLDGTPDEVLHRAAHTFFGFCVDDPPRHHLLFLRTIPGFAPSSTSYALAQEALDRLSTVLHAADLPSRSAVDLWTAVFTGLATQQVSNDPGGDRWARLVDPAVDLIVSMRQPSDR